MSHPKNSQVEQYYFEQFRRDFVLPLGEVIYTDKPDVVVRGHDALGIEVTNLYLVPGEDRAGEQAQRGKREEVLRQAQAAFSERGGKKFELSVDFDPSKAIRKIKPVSDALCSLAHRLAEAGSGLVSPILFQHIEHLRFVYLNANEYPDAKWRVVQSSSIPKLSVARLHELVAQKSAKLEEYQVCDRYWLLVVVDLIDPAQDQLLELPVGMSLGKSPYEKVLIYKPQYRQVVEVPQ